MKGVAEGWDKTRDKRQERIEDRGRKGHGHGQWSGTQQQPNLVFRITTPNYLPMESTTHTPTPKINFLSMQCMCSFYPHPTKINSVFDRILGGNCQVFRGVGS